MGQALYVPYLFGSPLFYSQPLWVLILLIYL